MLNVLSIGDTATAIEDEDSIITNDKTGLLPNLRRDTAELFSLIAYGMVTSSRIILDRRGDKEVCIGLL